MAILKKIIKWVLFFIFVSPLFGLTYIIYCWAHCGYTDNDIKRTFPNSKDSKIAVFKADTEGMPKIGMERFLIKTPYQYPFYSPQYYSDRFFIKFYKLTDSLTFVIDNKDTVRWSELYEMDTVPSRIKAYDHSGMLRVTYYQDTLFQSNIEHKPTVSIFKQVSVGPTWISDSLK